MAPHPGRTKGQHVTTEHTCNCSDVEELRQRITELETAMKDLKAALDTPRVQNNVAGNVGAHYQAGTISNLTIQ